MERDQRLVKPVVAFSAPLAGMLIAIATFVIIAGLVTVQSAHVPPGNKVWYVVRGLVSGFLGIGVGLALLVYARRTRMYEQRRQAAASGVDVVEQLLAADQPQEGVVHLIVDIRTRPRWTRLALYVIVHAALGSLSITFASAFAGDAPKTAASTFVFLVTLFPIWAVASYPLYFLGARQHIRVDDAGFTLRSGILRAQTLRWEDVRLFAIYGRGKKGARPIQFEVAGQNLILRWSWLSRVEAFRPFMLASATKPTESWLAYDAAIAGVVSTIRRRTGVLLYDLR